jgi:hypothetical protein
VDGRVGHWVEHGNWRDQNTVSTFVASSVSDGSAGLRGT